MAERIRSEEKRMMTHPELWPIWPALPVKRPLDRTPSMGCLVETAQEPDEKGFKGGIVEPIVYPHYFSAMMGSTDFADRLANPQKYQSIDDLLDDGWVVD